MYCVSLLKGDNLHTMLNEPADASRCQLYSLLAMMDGLDRPSEKHGYMAPQQRSAGQVSSLTNDHQTAVITMEPDRNDMRREEISRWRGGSPGLRYKGRSNPGRTKVISFIPTTNRLLSDKVSLKRIRQWMRCYKCYGRITWWAHHLWKSGGYIRGRRFEPCPYHFTVIPCWGGCTKT